MTVESAANETARKVVDQGLDAVEERVLGGLDAARKATENAVDHTADIQRQAHDTASEVTKTVTAYIQEKPLQAAGIAFAAGIVTTLLLSRR